jgi:hypothetical protein
MPAGPVQLTNANGTLQMRQAFDAVVAKSRCVCATIIQMSGEIPNGLEWKILSDVDFDRFEGLADAEDIYSASKSMFRCPTCGRLWVFWDGIDRPPQCYKPEELHDSGGTARLESE